MPYEIERIHAEQDLIVRELFIDTADDNYIAARWCFVEGLNVDYFWLSVHALEKYMKACLLLNGRSAKGYRDRAGGYQRFGHDIDTLYGQVGSFTTGLLPDTLVRPDMLSIVHWRDETPEAFIRRLHRDGNADNRYQIFGFVQHREDLFKLDAMVFALRRLCVRLDAYHLGRFRPAKTNLTNRDVLARQPEYWAVSPTCKIEKTCAGRRGERLRDVLLKFNFQFAPAEFEHGTIGTRTASQNPILGRSILEPLHRAPHSNAAATAAELCDWVLDNIQLPGDVKIQLRDARAKRKP